LSYGENGIDAWMLRYFGASAHDDPAVMRNPRRPTTCAT
jgi:hypothetical protein